MIDLQAVKDLLAECSGIVDELDGQEHSDSQVSPGSRNEETRAERAAKVHRSKSLQLLSDRLDLAAALVRNEYWFSRGEADPLNPDRED